MWSNTHAKQKLQHYVPSKQLIVLLDNEYGEL